MSVFFKIVREVGFYEFLVDENLDVYILELLYDEIL